MKKKNIILACIAILAIMFFVGYKIDIFLKQKNHVSGNFYTQSTTGGPSGHQIMAQATTTPCAIETPNSTTTLLGFTADMTTSTTTNYIGMLSESTTAFSTTTLLAELGSTANNLMTLNATSTTKNLVDNILPPNSWLIFSMQGGTGNFSPVGTCNASLGSVN